MANRKIVMYAAIAASYTVISLLLGSLSFGMIQFRVAEVLLVLCLYDKKLILPVTMGCLITNFIGIINGINPLILDLFVGTLATFISGVLVYYSRNIRWFNLPILSLLFPVLINGILVGLELCLYFPINPLMMMLYVAVGEFACVTVLGLFLYKPIGKAIKQYIEV